jgi:CheY-like chemotaxis protein
METVGRLAGGIAHDFNNLLTVISGSAELASAGLSEGDPLCLELQEIRQAAERAAALTRQLLAFSRRQMMKPEVLSLSRMVLGMRGMLQRLLGEDIDLDVVATEAGASVLADPGQIEQVVMNLAVNARDAMPAGGRLTIETREVELDQADVAAHPSLRSGPHVLLSVADTGIGMDEETRARLFEPFFTTKEVGKGTGLGLATVYGIVRQSGGSIGVDSDILGGTTFEIYLPRVENTEHEDRPAGTEEGRSGTETILVVEDQEALRQLTTRMLRSAGYRVIPAGDGEEALLLLERHDGPVHLVLTDVVLPGINGRDLATRIAQVRPEAEILYTSGYTDDAVLRHGVLDKAVHFIAKPYTVAELRRKIRELLDS